MEPAARAKPHPRWYQLLHRRQTDEESFQSGPTTLMWVPPYVFLPQGLPEAAMPPLVIFLSPFAAVGGRGGAAISPTLVFFSAVLAATGRRWGCRDGPPCVFAHLFRPCTVLQETMQPDFQCSSKKLKNILLFFSATVLGLYFALQSESSAGQN